MKNAETAMKIETVWFEHGGYSVYVNGEALLECLSEEELDALTIKEIKKLAEMYL